VQLVDSLSEEPHELSIAPFQLMPVEQGFRGRDGTRTRDLYRVMALTHSDEM
jgi:hypothetical protein